MISFENMARDFGHLRHLTISSHVFFVTTCPRPSCHTRDSPFLTFLEFPDIDRFWHMRCD